MAFTIGVLGSDRSVTLELPEPKETVLHEVVQWQLSKRRRGTAATKTRGMMSGTTAKMYPQKGTGRARHGSYKAPIFVGGGTTFGPQPRDYSYTLPKKVRRLGLAMALSARARDDKLTLVEQFTLTGKTKEFVAWAREHGFDGSERVLLVTDNELARRAARNLPWVGVMPRNGLNVYDILRFDRLVVDAAMFEGSNGKVAAAEVNRSVEAEPAAVQVALVEPTPAEPEQAEATPAEPERVPVTADTQPRLTTNDDTVDNTVDDPVKEQV